MYFLRFLLIFALIYYLLKWFGRLLSNPDRRRTRPRGGAGTPGEGDYRELTDQKIEDADYEEIEE